MKPIIFNAIDKLYYEKTGMIVPVSAAVGGEPKPVENLIVTNAIIRSISDGFEFTAKIRMHNIPDGWYGSLYYCDGNDESEYEWGCATSTFNNSNIQGDVLTFEVWDQGNGFVSPAHMAIFDNETDASNYYYDPENPYEPTGIMYADIEVPFITHGIINEPEIHLYFSQDIISGDKNNDSDIVPTIQPSTTMFRYSIPKKVNNEYILDKTNPSFPEFDVYNDVNLKSLSYEDLTTDYTSDSGPSATVESFNTAEGNISNTAKANAADVLLFNTPNYFYIQNEYNGDNDFYISGEMTSTPARVNSIDLSWSSDKENWTPIILGEAEEGKGWYITTLRANEKIFLRSSMGFGNSYMSSFGYIQLYPNKEYSVGGDLYTLLNYTDENLTDMMYAGAFQQLFGEKLISANNLHLGQLNNIGQLQMYQMFFNAKITEGIDLRGITSVSSNGMKGLYQWCFNLHTVYAPNVSSWNTSAFENWLAGAGRDVPAGTTKTVYCPAGVNIPTDSTSGIPTGWTRIDY